MVKKYQYNELHADFLQIRTFHHMTVPWKKERKENKNENENKKKKKKKKRRRRKKKGGERSGLNITCLNWPPPSTGFFFIVIYFYDSNIKPWYLFYKNRFSQVNLLISFLKPTKHPIEKRRKQNKKTIHSWKPIKTHLVLIRFTTKSEHIKIKPVVTGFKMRGHWFGLRPLLTCN